MAVMATLYRLDYDDYPVGASLATVGPFETYDEYIEWTRSRKPAGYGWQPSTIQSPDEYPNGKAWYDEETQ